MLRSAEGPINDGQSNIQHREVASAKHLVPNVSVELYELNNKNSSFECQSKIMYKVKIKFWLRYSAITPRVS